LSKHPNIRKDALGLKMKLIFFTLISLALFSNSYAQDLNLFQNIEVQADNEERPPRNQIDKKLETSPVFSVKGISRFGDKYIVSLLAGSGNPLTVQWSDNTSSSLRGFPGYSIVDVGSRSVSLVYPEGSGCTEFPDQGIKCTGSYMLLSLANGTPIEQKNGLEKTEGNNATILEGDELGVVDNEDGRFFRNPFSGEMQQIPDLSPEEQAMRDERRQRRAELFRDFEIVRIPDEEIPEGMQRVRTPFGDSLEPIDSE
jgi:hypothetical protein